MKFLEKTKILTVTLKKFLKKIYNNYTVDKESLRLLNQICLKLIKIFSLKTTLIVNHNKKIITDKDVEAVVKIVIPGLLCEEMIKKARTAIDKYKSFSSEEKKGRVLQSTKAGIMFPVARIGNMFKNHNELKKSVLVDIYMASVLEYIMIEIIDLSIERTKDFKKRITPDHMMFAIRNDAEITQLLKDFKIISLRGPQIREFKFNVVNLGNHMGLLTKPVIQKLLRRGGIKYISNLCYEELRYIILYYIKNVVKNL